MTHCDIRCDQVQFLIPTFEHPYEVVGSFLADDAQYSGADYFLEKASPTFPGGDPIRFYGNAHEVIIRRDNVSLENLYSDDFPPAVIKLDSFIEVLQFWKEIVKKWDDAGRPVGFTASAEFDFPAADVEEEC
jgi:hypothetical protein